MTKGEARAQFLRYLGAATVNGCDRADADLNDLFNYLLEPAVMQAAAQFPIVKNVSVSGEWSAPENFFEITQAFSAEGEPVGYRRVGRNVFRFEMPCTVEYAILPPALAPNAPEETELALDRCAALLVPVRAAIDAAVSTEEYAFRVPYLTAAYNGLLSALGDRNVAARRRVYAV